ncbi:MAG: SpaH/EbpB family LPXTG-anchored major pilin [Ruminococcus sp.]|nr:SpaH/EbpB family LPXTG-anchored major pilin [Ruminococcus sp.]
MRKHRRFAAILTAGLLAVTPCVSAGVAFAADETYSITINPAENDKAEHTYEAYQIFDGDLSTEGEDKILSNIVWGPGIDSSKTAALETAIKTNIFTDLTDTTAAKIAEKLKDASAAQVRQFADLIGSVGTDGKYLYLSTTKVTDATAGNGDAAVIANCDPGYYLVKDADNSLDGVESSAYTRFILRVVGDATANAKAVLPTLDKKITSSNQNDDGTANTAAIGEKVNYELTSAVPNMEGYNKYYFVINDDLSDGLSFNNDVKVYVNGAADPIASNLYEVQQGTDADGHTFQIVFKDFYTNFNNKAGQAIRVTYSATLDEDAKITNEGNPNTANLTYSNNPNYNYTGENEPGSGEPKGVTPEKTVKTYTTAVKVKKVDESNKALTGAEFTLTGADNCVKTVIVISDEFVAGTGSDATYYKLADGTFTEEEPASADDPNYADTTTKYKKTQTATTKDTSTDGVTVSCEVGTDGIAVFKGLGKGTYTLTESKTPTNYNTIEPIEFTIGTGTTQPDMTSANWSITSDETFSEADNMFVVTIKNVKGSTLPETGGIGTKLFYLFGGMLAVGSGVVLVTKKRMANIEK